jgi:DNA polymerase II small subunit/DNA polymerase delta subunit B
MLSFQEYMRLGPEATKKQDKEELRRQKDHLMVMSKQSQQRADELGDESGMTGAFKSKAAAYAKLAHNIKEDGMVGVAGIAGSGDTRLPATQREPGVSKKNTPVMGNIRRRSPPKM